MGKSSRRRARQRKEDVINDNNAFEFVEQGRRSRIAYTRIFLAMMVALFLVYCPYLSDRGSKTSEMKRDRMPFEEKVDAKLSENIFRRIYRMSWRSFYRLHSILEGDLVKAFYPKGGSARLPGTNSYLINTKTRLSIAIRFFAGSDPTDLVQIHGVVLISIF